MIMLNKTTWHSKMYLVIFTRTFLIWPQADFIMRDICLLSNQTNAFHSRVWWGGISCNQTNELSTVKPDMRDIWCIDQWKSRHLVFINPSAVTIVLIKLKSLLLEQTTWCGYQFLFLKSLNTVLHFLGICLLMQRRKKVITLATFAKDCFVGQN